ncbi:MAG TPA: hypothetical protein G4O20_00690 [Dehalococcoidia bacterium]|nr:hypothetical protein [Dehalococcoidia bacterium]
MEWQIIVALVLIIPVLLIPVAYVWYLNIGGLYAVMKQARARRLLSENKKREMPAFVSHFEGKH